MRYSVPATLAFSLVLLGASMPAVGAAKRNVGGEPSSGFAGAAFSRPMAAGAQEQGAPRVALTQSAGPPGGRVAVPIQLTIPEGVDLGTLSLTIRVPSDSLTFQSLALGGLADGVGMTAETTSTTEGNDVVLRIRLATPEQGGARVPLPSGPIGDLVFGVSKNAVAETIIRLPVEASASAANGGAAVEVQKKDGQVVVSNPSVDTCFFYMH